MDEPNREYGHKASSGIEGLDYILKGGFLRNRIHLIQGATGTGKTTLGLQFLMEGAREGERCLYITVLQSKYDLFATACSHEWNLQGIEIEELSTLATTGGSACEQTLFHTAEVELSETIDTVEKIVERVKPSRLVLDSISEIQLLANAPYRFQSQLVALKRFLTGRGCTVLLLSGDNAMRGEDEFGFLVDGVLHLEQKSLPYGQVLRRLEVIKMRGMTYRSGYHDFRINTGG